MLDERVAPQELQSVEARVTELEAQEKAWHKERGQLEKKLEQMTVKHQEESANAAKYQALATAKTEAAAASETAERLQEELPKVRADLAATQATLEKERRSAKNLQHRLDDAAHQ